MADKNTKSEKEQSTSFLVDIGKTMVDINRISSEGKDLQRLYCKCGHNHDFKNKVRRSVIKKHDTTVEDKHSIESVTCPSCKTVYSAKNRPFLLIPDEDEIYNISFRTEENGSVITLFRDKYFANFNSASDKLNDKVIRTDYIKFDRKNKTTKIFLSKPSLDKTATQQKQSDSSDVSEEIGLSKISRLEHFFSYFDFGNYTGLDNIFKFFNKIDDEILNLEDLKRMVPVFNFAYKNNELTEEKDEITGENQTFIYTHSGYGDGKKIKSKLNVGSYLSRFVEISQVFFCISEFPSIATILLTKGYTFFNEFLHSKNILPASIYKNLEATSPHRIMEVSMNHDSSGGLKPKENENGEAVSSSGKKQNKDFDTMSEKNKGLFLKVSPVIYKNITTPSDMETLLSVYRKKFVTKTDIETLFQDYKSERIYAFYQSLIKERIHDGIYVTMKHIKHIFDKNVDDVSQKGVNTNFLHLYVDTLHTMNLLELPASYIHTAIKDNKSLKEVHDDLAARYGAIKDAKKAEFYKKATKELEKINTQINDVDFTVVPTLEDLNKEGMTMSHCVYTYLDRVVNKDYVVVHVQHSLSNERATIGMMRKNGLEFDQLKGYQNSRPSRELIESVVEFLEVNNIRNSRNSGDLTPSPGSQKRMHDYLSDKEVEELRMKRAKREKEEMEKHKKEGKKYTPKYDERGYVIRNKKGMFGKILGDN